MKPLDPDTFERIQLAVESLGGTNLTDVCKPHVIPSNNVKLRASTSGCGRANKMAVPYQVIGSDKFPHDAMRQRGAGIVIACAQDDMMDQWPRVAARMKERTA